MELDLHCGNPEKDFTLEVGFVSESHIFISLNTPNFCSKPLLTCFYYDFKYIIAPVLLIFGLFLCIEGFHMKLISLFIIVTFSTHTTLFAIVYQTAFPDEGTVDSWKFWLLSIVTICIGLTASYFVSINADFLYTLPGSSFGITIGILVYEALFSHFLGNVICIA